MDYNLAKELLENGFPRENILESIDGEYQFPTLSELIEACKQANFTLTLDATGKTWIAEIFQTDYEGEGDTAEIAVAKLWLALNKK